MANNRLYIKCLKCGEQFYIVKEFSGWQFFIDATAHEDYIGRQCESIESFFDKHFYQCGLQHLSLIDEAGRLPRDTIYWNEGHPGIRYGGVSKDCEIVTDKENIYLARWHSVEQAWKLKQEPGGIVENVKGWRWAK